MAVLPHSHEVGTLVRPGENLQRLVEAIERATHENPNVTVKSSKRLRDKDTAKMREHDVVITFTAAHHTMNMAIECRDRTRPVGVPDIEAFNDKCKGTGIDRGIVVSSLGFRNTAVTKAARYNIGCLTLTEAVAFDWCIPPGVWVRTLLRTDMRAEADVPETELAGATTCYEDGREFSPDTEQLRQIGQHCLSMVSDRPQISQGITERVFADNAPKFHAIMQDGRRVAINKLYIKATTNDQCYVLDLRKYMDLGVGRLIYDSAIAEVTEGAIQGDIVLLGETGKEPRISFVSRSRPVVTTSISKVIRDDIVGLHLTVSEPMPAGSERNSLDLKVTSIDPEILDPLVESVLINRLGVAHANKGHFQRALIDFHEAIKLNPVYADALRNRGSAYAAMGEHDLAIIDLSEAIRLRPKYAEAYYNRGIARHRKGEYDAAIMDYGRAITLNPAYAEAFNNRGAAYTEQGNLDRAIKDYDRAIKLNPAYAEAFYNRGTAHLLKNRYTRAITDFDQAIKLNPDYTDAFNNRSFARRGKGDVDGADADSATASRLRNIAPGSTRHRE